MHEIGDLVKIAEDHRWAYIYDVYKDRVYSNTYYYQVVWDEEDLYQPRPAGSVRVLFWDTDLVSPKTRMLKNGKRLILSH